MINNNSSLAKKTFWTAFIFYFLIGFEFLYMATPFAFYFYSVYRPGLEFIDQYPSIAWVTGFFLPHIVEDTKSPVLDLLRPAGGIIAVTGLLSFLVCAFQVYYAKLFKKGVVKGGLYKFIRHPQYTSLAICSFGLLILWPRYLALIMFISVLYAYYFLAQAEEKECQRKFGAAYLKYKESTGMFFPFRIKFLKYFSIDKLALPARTLVIAFLLIASWFTAVKAADQLKKYSISMLYTFYTDKDAYVSILNKNEDDIKEITELYKSDRTADSIKTNNRYRNIISYIVPADFYISEVPMVKPAGAGNHIFQSDYSSSEFKIIVTKAKVKEGSWSGSSEELLFNTLSLEPLIEYRINLKEMKIVNKTTLPDNEIRYKNIPEPVF